MFYFLFFFFFFFANSTILYFVNGNNLFQHYVDSWQCVMLIAGNVKSMEGNSSQ